MLNLSLNELKQIAKMKCIKGYKIMSKERLLSVLSEPESAESKKNFENEKLKKILKDFNEWRYGFSKSKIKEIRKNLYEIENKKNLSKPKIKEIEKNLPELEESLSRLTEYYDYDDSEYRGIRDIENIFNQSIDEDYYKPIRTNPNGFDNKNNYIEYESKEDKDKILLPGEYLNMIRPYLSDATDDHKAHRKLQVHSGNKIIDYKTQSEWKIQLTMSIIFISSKDSDEICKMHAKSDNIEIMMSSETEESIKELFKSLLQKYQERLEESMRGSEFISYSVDLLYYQLHKTHLKNVKSYIDSPKWLTNKKETVNK